MPPTSIVARLKTIYTREKEVIVPSISTTVAITSLIVYTLIYVLPLYISPASRPSHGLNRDAPSVIKRRTQLVSTSCIACSIITFFVLYTHASNSSPTQNVLEGMHRMGYLPIGLGETIKALALTATLFMGPLFEGGIEGRWRRWLKLEDAYAVLSSWQGWRNFVTGPITEEILFRSAAVPLLLLAQISNTTIIFLTPVVFGLAHVHHFYEYRITHPHDPIIQAILRSVLQFTYTTLFGGYVTFLYLRTGSLLSVIFVHAFCNWQGFPRFWGKVSAGETVMGPDIGESKRSEDGPARSAELGLGWTVAYYVILCIGAWGWWRLLWPLTASESALTSF
ncbi:CAAX protease self-immunity-domain-containing protein [Calycina marina]|uniref:intramembrane prenyl-peptidase Rce1 n=1 Tax=Calycina marina TaxID=1763456 RepID=A0A9P8CCA3_9HELO|nr:CAAX protease self-immunity-domain-containing protein [Calycina marina]